MFDFRRVFGVCVAIGMLAGCGGSQAQMGTPGAVNPGARQVRMASGSGNCPALPGGTGILSDGDFSQAVDPGKNLRTYDKGYVFAPNWEASKGNVDFNGSTYWNVDGLCSVDLDGLYTVGGIRTSAFNTEKGATYTLSFVLSGNGHCAPTVKTMKVAVNRQFTAYTWNISSGNDAQDGDYLTETWQFSGSKRPSILSMTSQDPKKSSCGAVVAGMAITKN